MIPLYVVSGENVPTRLPGI